MKYAGINLIKYVHDLYAITIKLSWKNKKDLNNEELLQVHRIKGVNIVKVLILPNLTYRFDVISR